MNKKTLTEDSVDTAVVFGVIRDLSVFSEDDLASSSHHTKLRDIHFDDSTLGEYTKLCVHW